MSVIDSQTQNGVVAKNQSAKKTFAEQVSEAIANYKAKHPGASEQEIVEHKARVEAGVKASAAKLHKNVEAEIRKERATKLKTEADKINVRFKVLRAVEDSAEIVTRSKLLDTEGVGSWVGQFKVLEENIKSARTLQSIIGPAIETVIRGLSVANKGGAVIAYYLHTDATNRVYAMYAVSVCDAGDNFDALYGKESAFARLQAGMAIDEELEHSGLSLTKFSERDYHRMLRTYQIVHFYNKKSKHPQTITVETNTLPSEVTV